MMTAVWFFYQHLSTVLKTCPCICMELFQSFLSTGKSVCMKISRMHCVHMHQIDRLQVETMLECLLSSDTFTFCSVLPSSSCSVFNTPHTLLEQQNQSHRVGHHAAPELQRSAGSHVCFICIVMDDIHYHGQMWLIILSKCNKHYIMYSLFDLEHWLTELIWDSLTLQIFNANGAICVTCIANLYF